MNFAGEYRSGEIQYIISLLPNINSTQRCFISRSIQYRSIATWGWNPHWFIASSVNIFIWFKTFLLPNRTRKRITMTSEFESRDISQRSSHGVAHKNYMVIKQDIKPTPVLWTQHMSVNMPIWNSLQYNIVAFIWCNYNTYFPRHISKNMPWRWIWRLASCVGLCKSGLQAGAARLQWYIGEWYYRQTNKDGNTAEGQKQALFLHVIYGYIC